MSRRSSNTEVVIDLEPIPAEAASVNTGVETIDGNQTRDLGRRIRSVPIIISTTSFMENGDSDEEKEMSSLKQDLHSSAFFGSWDRAKSILDRYPELVRIPLIVNNRYTAFHIAVSQGNTNFVREFVNYENVTPQDLEIQDAKRNNAFCLAAISGNSELLEIMIQKNKDLSLIHGQDGMLPIQLAILNDSCEAVRKMYSRDLLEKMAIEEIHQFFFMAINTNLCDVAYDLLLTHGKSLAFARDDEEKTALHIMALKPFDFHYPSGFTPQNYLVEELWHIGDENLENSERMQLITTPSVLLFDAVKSNNYKFLDIIMCSRRDPYQWELKDPATGQTILHTAVLFRQDSIISFLLNFQSDIVKTRAVDKERNNVLHFAARQLEQQASLSLRPDIRMRRELEWFKEMENKFPSELRTMRNKDGMTPNDMFYTNHRKLSDEVKDTAKAVANTGMVVAALVVTVAFAAALTTPGDKNNAWFSVFIMANAAALFTSALSIVAFLSIFTSSTFKESEFVTSLYPSLIIGKRLLFISLVTMIIAFAAACFLIFDHKYKQEANVVASFGLLTIILILQLQLSLFNVLTDYFFSSLKSIKKRKRLLEYRIREKFS